MHKVVVERPRHGRSWASSNVPPKPPFDECPRYESMKASHSRRKWFSDLLGPLRRWLQSQVGRPWNDVYSEACAVIKPDSIIRAHVKTHLLEFVERDTFMHKKEVCVLDTSWSGEPKPVSANCRYRSLYYVHPETGLLQISPSMSKREWRAREPRPPVTFKWIRNGVALNQIRGLWFECHFKGVTFGERSEMYDHALERFVERSDVSRYDNQYLLCTFKRQLSKRQLREFKLRNGPLIQPVGAQPSASRHRLADACASIFRTHFVRVAQPDRAPPSKAEVAGSNPAADSFGDTIFDGPLVVDFRNLKKPLADVAQPRESARTRVREVQVRDLPSSFLAMAPFAHPICRAHAGVGLGAEPHPRESAHVRCLMGRPVVQLR